MRKSIGFSIFAVLFSWLLFSSLSYHAYGDGAPVMHPIIAMSSDGSELVYVYVNPPSPLNGQQLAITVEFMDTSERNIKHQNYNITVAQDGKTIFSKVTAHTHTGTDFQTTSALTSSDPVDIKVTLNGVGLPGTDPSMWTGPKGDVVTFHVVPEFGSIAPIILAIAVVSIVMFTVKIRITK